MIASRPSGEAIGASPVDPHVEYLASEAGYTRCGCPRRVVGAGGPRRVIVLSHRTDCGERHPQMQTEAPAEPRPAGAIPCPNLLAGGQVCGNVAFSLTASGLRRCAGPCGCGHEWRPSSVAVTRPRPAWTERRAS